jgi:hypothetical protein
VHDVAWPHPCAALDIVVIPLLDPVPPPELPLDPLLDRELPELLAVPVLEPELLDVAPELLPLRVPEALLITLPPLLPLPPPVGWPLFITGVEAPLEVPLVSTGRHVVVPPGLGVDVQPKIETATRAAVPWLIEWRFFIPASRTVELLEGGTYRGQRAAPRECAKRESRSELRALRRLAASEHAVYDFRYVSQVRADGPGDND